MRKERKRVPLNQSALYKMTSVRMLGKILLTPEVRLRDLASRDNYIRFERSGRQIEEPKPDLKRIHARFADLLAQIETPDYLHSAVKSKSYISNASVHSAKGGCIKLDVQKFYPSSRSQPVFHFFKDVLDYPGDVASLATRLLTADGHLPTGGNASPILSFWAYRPMFDRIDRLAKEHGCEFTLYVDDMTISGEIASRLMMRDARRIVGSYRLKAHKSHVFKPGQPRVLTGVAMTLKGRRVPVRRQQAIGDALAALSGASSDADRLYLLAPLIGRICEAAQVDAPNWQMRASSLIHERRAIVRRLRATGWRPSGGR